MANDHSDNIRPFPRPALSPEQERRRAILLEAFPELPAARVDAIASSDSFPRTLADAFRGGLAVEETAPSPATPSERPIDRVLRKLSQLDVMLQLVFGAGADNFNELTEDARDTYLWACHDQVKDALDGANAACAASGRPAG